MIIEARKEILSLSGPLTQNQWLNLKVAADLLLMRYPQGIIIEGSGITRCTPDGIETFKEAFAFIHHHGSRIVCCHLPPEVQTVMRDTPEARSQLALAASIEEARTSLGLDVLKFEKSSLERFKILVPVFKGIDGERSAHITARIRKKGRSQIYLLYLLEIPRVKPMDTPLPEAEATAKETLALCQKKFQEEGVKSSAQIKRVRSLSEGIISTRSLVNADLIVLSIQKLHGLPSDPFTTSILKTLQTVPCEILVEWGQKSGWTVL